LSIVRKTPVSGLRGATDVAELTERTRLQQALREREEALRAIIDSSLDGIVSVGRDGRIVEFNPAAEAMFGYARSEAIGAPMVERIIPARLRDAHRSGFERHLAGGQARMIRQRTETQAMRADGSEFPVELVIAPFAAGGAQSFAGFLRDITERKAAEKALRESQAGLLRLARVYAVLSGINSAIVRIRDRTELLQEACRIAVESGGFVIAWAGIVDRNAGIVRPVGWAGEDARSYLETMPPAVFETRSGGPGIVGQALIERKAVVSNEIANDVRLLTRKECLELGANSLAVLPIVLGEEAVGALALLAAETGFFDEREMTLLRELASDISFALDYIAKADKVNYLAYYDVVTGLANPALLLDRMAQYLSHAALQQEGAALILFDVQRFRNVNDSLGRHASDEVLRAIAQRLKACVAEESSPARVGADLFAFIAKNVASEREAMEVATGALKACFGAPILVDREELRLAGRMGIALFPADAAAADALYRNAEAALAKAKKEGEACLFYSRDMTARVAEKLALEGRLRHALEAHEFVLHYQPKISTRTGAVTSVEALIRWANPEGILVPPADFIPLLEETGLILPVGEWALHEAVRQYCAWRAQGVAAPRIAVNVSALQLRSKDFVSVLRSAAATAPDGEHGLDLEITESVIMSNVEDNVEKLSAAKRMGMRIFVDDFGTGHSSLRYIARLPLDALKIDRSFVIAMSDSPQDMTIVSSILALGRDLSLKVVAEGVDNDDQARLLRLLKSDEMQGFLFSRPLTADGIVSLLAGPQPALEGF
jgi:PAS domain S-box-containing protein/diguanylate cyclase (GGDEF)-like protein